MVMNAIDGMMAHEYDMSSKSGAVLNDPKVDIPRYAISTPDPQTELYKKLEKEGSLLHKH